MAITARVKNQYFQNDQRLIRLAPNQDHSLPTKRAGTPWTPLEHDLFLEALERYPSGPWKAIAAHIGTRATRQTMTHAQNYREKIARRKKTKAATSPKGNPGRAVPVVTVREHFCTKYDPLASKPVSIAAPPTDQDASEATKYSTVTVGVQGQFAELELDESVITLLEMFEPLEMPEPWSPATDVCTTMVNNAQSEWLNVDSPFQQCIPL